MLEGDSLLVMKDIPDESFDAVVTDPPYGMAFESFRRVDLPHFDKIANDEAGRPFIWWMYDAYRLVKAGGSVICFCNWANEEAFRLALGWAGFTIKSQAIWDRGVHGVGDLNGTFAPQHDVIWYATKGKGRLYGLRPKSVISASRLSAQSMTHPNEKPVPLMRYLIRAVTPQGGTVLDPFAGSGATGVAALMEGRWPTMIELTDYNCEIIRKKMGSVQTTFDALLEGEV